MFCNICSRLALSRPPLSPKAAMSIIERAGEFRQISLDAWIYFHDDQDQEIHDSYDAPSISAVCTCGNTVFDTPDEIHWRKTVANSPPAEPC